MICTNLILMYKFQQKMDIKYSNCCRFNKSLVFCQMLARKCQ